MLDVIVIGAGAAGLAAGIDLARSGLSVTILEARDRIGGRMFTRQDSAGNAIELGAEFIHGRPREIWDILRQHGVPTSEVRGQPWCMRDGQLRPCDLFSQVDDLLEQMTDNGPDEAFTEFLARHPEADEQTRRRALGYVSGFNAADPELVSVHWLVAGKRAEEDIQGERAFRMQGGYGSLVRVLEQRAAGLGVAIELNTIVSRVWWSGEEVKVSAHRDGDHFDYSAGKCLVTVPLSILQAPANQPACIQFVPDLPPRFCDAMDQLEMGKVIRITLRFRERFWKDLKPDGAHTLNDMGFLFTLDEQFPTWWTMAPEDLPIITAWAPFRAAEALSGQSAFLVLASALDSLSHTLKVDRQKLEDLLDSAFTHDWQSDPFSLGAYTYARAGGAHAPDVLSEALEGKLFFAGEATDASHTGTVHGAIASGHRAAKQMLSISD